MSDLILVIGNKNYSSWSLRPWLFMKQAGIPFVEKRVPLFQKNTKKQLTPYFSNSKVPVLQDGEMVIWDSLAILEYLAEHYPAWAWPTNMEARAIARSISAEMHSGFFAVRNELALNCRKVYPNFTLSEEVKRDIQRITEIWRFCREKFGGEGPWLFGEFTIADAMYAPVALRFHTYDVSLGEIEKKYAANMLAHPYIKEWVEAAKEEKEVLEDYDK